MGSISSRHVLLPPRANVQFRRGVNRNQKCIIAQHSADDSFDFPSVSFSSVFLMAPFLSVLRQRIHHLVPRREFGDVFDVLVGLERLPVARILINKLPRRRITVDPNKAPSPLTRGRQRHPGRGCGSSASRWLASVKASTASCLFDDSSRRRDPL